MRKSQTETKDFETKVPATGEAEEITGRREAISRFGKFAAYAAPFTVVAMAEKADAATGKGPGKHA